MKISVLASGSKGNVSYIETAETKVLVDLGMNSIYVERELKNINIDPKNIDGIILTHTHSDHINGLRVFVKKYKTKVYLTKRMLEEINKLFILDNYELIENDFSIKDLDIETINTSHDAPDSKGYIFKSNDKRISYITDTGYLNRKYKDKLSNINLYVMESNHDIKLLQNGRYPYYLKQRILSDKGHLSNEMCSKYLVDYMGEKTKTIILIHLSQENNDPEVALTTLKNRLKENNITFDNIIISEQNKQTGLIEV